MATSLDSRTGQIPPLGHPLEDGWTLPASWYSDPGVAERERERVFAGSWQYGGPAEQVGAPGSYMATQAGHIPIVVTRDREGALRGFVNVCRHRAYVIARDSGCRETLQCPYHAWTYELDGSLRKAPRSEREAGFDRGRLLAAPGLRRHVGALPVRQLGPRRAAARGGARRASGDRRAERPRPLDPAPPLPRRVADRGELEGRARELPRVLPLSCRASRVQQGDRRRPRLLRAHRLADLLEPDRPDPGLGSHRQRPRVVHARGRRDAIAVPLPLSEHDDQHRRRARRTSRSSAGCPTGRARRSR